MVTNFAVIGMPGTGKTALMAIFANKYKQMGAKKIYSNFKLQIPGEPPFSELIVSYEDLDKARYGIAFLDEIAANADARRGMSNDNALTNKPLQTFRKHGIDCMYWSAQIYGMGDVRLRLNTKYIILPEIYYTVDGKQGSPEFTLEDDFFNPINRDKYLPYARIRAPLISAWVYENMTDLTQQAALRWFDFPILPATYIYDTTEEIQKFAKNRIDKAVMTTEVTHKDILQKYFGVAVTLNPDSGKNQLNKLDIEFEKDGKLYIIDSTTLVSQPAANGGHNLYLELKYKLPMTRFTDIEKARDGKCYFMFEEPRGSGNVWLYPIAALIKVKVGKYNVKNLDPALKIKVQ